MCIRIAFVRTHTREENKKKQKAAKNECAFKRANFEVTLRLYLLSVCFVEWRVPLGQMHVRMHLYA